VGRILKIHGDTVEKMIKEIKFDDSPNQAYKVGE
jgi:hypothetical protein